MKLTALIAVLATGLTAFSATAAGAATERTASAAARQFEGTVVSVNRDGQAFRLKDVERGTVRIKVTRNTRFERIDGLAGLKVGRQAIEATVKRKNGAWVALRSSAPAAAASTAAAATTAAARTTRPATTTAATARNRPAGRDPA